MNIFFISGTDTNVGKTEITCALMRVISNQDKIVVGMKPISAGVEKIREGYLNKDVDKIMNAASFSYDISKVNSYSFDEPIAPHIAADKVNCRIDFNLIQNNLNQIKEKADYVFIEGAGGHEVPLDKTRTMADLVTSLDIPIISFKREGRFSMDKKHHHNMQCKRTDHHFESMKGERKDDFPRRGDLKKRNHDLIGFTY